MEAKEKIYFKLCKKLNDKGEVTEKNIEEILKKYHDRITLTKMHCKKTINTILINMKQ